MYQLATNRQFEKDYKLCKKKCYNLELLHHIFGQLEQNGYLAAKYKPHKLTGNYQGFWEFHVRPDWLLIWLQDDEAKTITFTRTGTHSDLF